MLFRSRYHAPERLERQMRFAQKLAEVLPVYALEYPRSFAALDEVSRELRRVASS